MKTVLFLILVLFTKAFFSVPVQAQVQSRTIQRAAVATAHPMATQAGVDILKKGGNAFDAAAAITASLAVVEPGGSGLGGGGFWLIHRASDGRQIMIDGREKAPRKAHQDMYLDHEGNVIKGMSLNGPAAAGIPGIPAGIEHLVKRYGRLSLKQILAPAIRQARQGFPVTRRFQKQINFRLDIIRRYPHTATIFLDDNQLPALGALIVQNDLANTLNMIAEGGSKAFYTGALAEQLVRSVRQNGGFWEKQDLLDYNIIEREPVVIDYKGMKITSAPPPSSGGIVLGQILNMLQHYDLKTLDSVSRKHLIVEAMRRAYRDRAVYLGDADFVNVPTRRLLDAKYTEGLALTIDMDGATPSEVLGGIPVDNPVGTDTTHFSVVDQEGNRVAATLSINLLFGSGFIAGKTGVLLNNEMDDFSVKPLAANAYDLIGAEANAIAPGKRPLSSMSPTFIESDDRIGILGTPGGSRIISMVLLGILDFAEGKLPDSWVHLPRFHHQYIPDRIEYEAGGLSKRDIAGLQAKGHELSEKKRRYGNMQAIMIWKKKGLVFAASDPRGEGKAQLITP